MKIRPARKEDLKDMISINLVTLPEHYPEAFWEEKFKDFQFLDFVAEEDKNIIGYVFGFQIDFPKYPNIRGVLLASIAVLPEFRNRGIATGLIRAFLRSAKLHNYVVACLQVRVNNENAINLYHKLGWTLEDVVQNYYSDGTTALLYLYNLHNFKD